MGAWDNIRHRIYRLDVKRGLTRSSPNHRLIPFDRATRIGILFRADRPERVVVVNNFAGRIQAQNKKVELLGYLNGRQGQDVHNFHWFNRRDVTWYGKPKGKTPVAFMNKPFDILICAWIGECRPLEYIATFSKASWRIGQHAEHKEMTAEFLISLKPGRSDLEYFFSQVDHFLKTIRSHEHSPSGVTSV